MTEATDENSYYQRTTCQTEFDWSGYARKSDRKTTQQDTQEDTHEDSHNIRRIQTFQLITQYSCNTLYGILLANDHYTVTYL